MIHDFVCPPFPQLSHPPNRGKRNIKNTENKQRIESKTEITTKGIGSNPVRVRHDGAKIPIIQKKWNAPKLEAAGITGTTMSEGGEESRMGSWDGRWRRSNGYEMDRLRLTGPWQSPQKTSTTSSSSSTSTPFLSLSLGILLSNHG